MVRIGFVAAHNPFDRNQFSGTVYYMKRALEGIPGVQVDVIGKRFFEAEGLSNRAHKAMSYGRFASLKWVRDRGFKLLMEVVEKDLARLCTQLDFIVAPVASEVIASVKNPRLLPPVIFITDATPKFIQETYAQKLEAIAHEQEHVVLKRCLKAVYSSHYMANKARREFADLFESDPEKADVIPFGLNMDRVPVPKAPKKIDGKLELLFVGKEWERKGGAIALDMLRDLTARGVNARLTVIGCQPEPRVVPKNVEVISYLNKNVPEQQKRYLDILERSHILVLPTRADCTPMVIAEANAVGMPVIITNVGGIGTLVEEGVNGQLLPLEAGAEAYADIAENLTQQPELYRKLSKGGRRVYEERLNWDAWAQQILEMAESLGVVGEAVPESASK